MTSRRLYSLGYRVALWLCVGVAVCSLDSVACEEDLFKDSVVLETIQNVTYYQIGPFHVSNKTALPEQCRSKKTQYKLMIKEDPGVFRLPHSRIFENDVRCGDKNETYPDEQLYLEPHMKLVPYAYIQSAEVATKHGVRDVQRAFNASYRTHVLHTAKDFSTILLDNDIWVGYEGMEDRVCGGNLVHVRGTFVLFGRSKDENVTADFRMVNPSTNLNVTMKIVFPDKDDIHLSLEEVFEQTPFAYDRVCPSVSGRKIPFAPQVSLETQETQEATGSSSCFPGDSMVLLANGSRTPMSRSHIGLSLRDAENKATPIFMFTHRDTSAKLHRFLEVSTHDGSMLTVSPGHYVMTAAHGLQPASSLRVGSVMTKFGEGGVTVVRISEVLRRGLYNPQTTSGTLVVDGFSVSAYTTTVSPVLAHAVLSPARLLFTFTPRVAYFFDVLSNVFDAAEPLWPFVRFLVGSS